LLEDLHVGTLVAVKLGGQVGKEFTIISSVHQGCVVAPLLFNVLLDFVVRHALADMPEEVGVSMGYHGDGRMLFERRAKGDLTLYEISLLLYANDMVLFSTKPENLVLMLKAMDSTADRFSMRINASKTKIMSVGKGTSQLLVDVTINGDPIELVDQFKYLGGVLSSDTKLDAKVAARQGQRLGAFAQFECVWGNECLKLNTKVQVFDTFIVLHFLHGNETWNLTQT
jgi:hypothetical protein